MTDLETIVRGKTERKGFSIDWRAYPPGTVPCGTEARLKPEYDIPANYTVIRNEWGALVPVIRPGLPEDWLEYHHTFFDSWFFEVRLRGFGLDLAGAQLTNCQQKSFPDWLLSMILDELLAKAARKVEEREDGGSGAEENQERVD